jgi:hypothetical protein
MPQFACILNGEIHHLTDDDDLAFAFMLEHADEDWDHTEFSFGDVVNGATVELVESLTGDLRLFATAHWVAAHQQQI